jgi:hypothetical protein
VRRSFLSALSLVLLATLTVPMDFAVASPQKVNVALGKPAYGTVFTGYSISAVNDGNKDTLWYSASGKGSNPAQDRLVIDLESPKEIASMQITATYYSLKGFTIQYSDDNVTFVDAFSSTHVQEDKITKGYSLPTGLGKHRYWAIYVTSTWVPSASSGLYEIEMYESGGSETLVPLSHGLSSISPRIFIMNYAEARVIREDDILPYGYPTLR